MDYDAVMSVSFKDRHKAVLSIRHLLKNAAPEKIFVITPKRSFKYFSKINKNLILINENTLIPGVTLLDIKKYLLSLSPPNYMAGWYFQQFLKMAMCYHRDILEHYLIWDADTILLQPLEFFTNQGKILVTKAHEFHPPYFDVLFKILKEKRHVDFSFIAQHMMIKTAIMKELIGKIEKSPADNDAWIWKIIHSLSNRSDCPGFENSLKGLPEFSEYETYGNYIHNHYPETVEYRELAWHRDYAYKGHFPTDADLEKYTLHYCFIAFEAWYPVSVVEKIWSYIRFFLLALKLRKLKLKAECLIVRCFKK